MRYIIFFTAHRHQAASERAHQKWSGCPGQPPHLRPVAAVVVAAVGVGVGVFFLKSVFS